MSTQTVELPEAPAGWQLMDTALGQIYERKYGPATARVEKTRDGFWRSWACAYHPNARDNFVTAHNQAINCSEFRRAINYAEEAGEVLQAWIREPEEPAGKG